MSNGFTPPSRQFPSTHWSVVVRVGDADPDVRRQALEALILAYRGPMLAHLVRVRRVDRDRAEDLLQGFIADKLIAQELFEKARSGKGRLRSLLTKSLERYCTDRHRFENAQKRSPGQQASLALDESIAAAAAPDVDSFDVAWARGTLDQAAQRMREECMKTGRELAWQVFHARLIEPMLEGQQASHAELASRLDLGSPARASEVLVTGKRIFLRCLRDVVGQYVADPDEIDEEIRDLRRVLASTKP